MPMSSPNFCDFGMSFPHFGAENTLKSYIFAIICAESAKAAQYRPDFERLKSGKLFYTATVFHICKGAVLYKNHFSVTIVTPSSPSP